MISLGMASMNCRARKIPNVAAAPGMITAQKVPIRPSPLTIRNCGTKIAWVGIIIVASMTRNSTFLPGNTSLANA